MSKTQPTYDEFLCAANFLVENDVLVSANNIKDHLGRGSITQIKTHMLERERQRNAVTAIFGGILSEKLILAIAEEIQKIVEIRTVKLVEELERKCQENLALQEQLAKEQTESQRLRERSHNEQKSFAQERNEWADERSQMRRMLDMAQKTIQILAQTKIDRQSETRSDALLESIKLFFRQLAGAFAYKNMKQQKNIAQNLPPNRTKEPCLTNIEKRGNHVTIRNQGRSLRAGRKKACSHMNLQAESATVRKILTRNALRLACSTNVP